MINYFEKPSAAMTHHLRILGKHNGLSTLSLSLSLSEHGLLAHILLLGRPLDFHPSVNPEYSRDLKVKPGKHTLFD